MAYRCTIGNHTQCAACKSAVTPYERDHAHIFRGGGHKDDTICGLCWLSTIAAALGVLHALREAGYTWNSYNELATLLNNRVLIAVQTELGLSPEQSN
jgi:hypothetical protein